MIPLSCGALYSLLLFGLRGAKLRGRCKRCRDVGVVDDIREDKEILDHELEDRKASIRYYKADGFEDSSVVSSRSSLVTRVPRPKSFTSKNYPKSIMKVTWISPKPTGQKKSTHRDGLDQSVGK